MRSATYLPYERQGCRPPAARLIPVEAAWAPQHDTVGIAIGRAELEFPISGVDVLKLSRRSVVVLRPKVEKDRLAWTKRAVFRRLVRGARGPCPTIVVEGMHGWGESVDVAGELLPVSAIFWGHSGQGVVTVIPDGLAWRVSARPVREGRQHLQVLTHGAGRALQRQLFDVEDHGPRIGHICGHDRVERAAAGKHAIVLAMWPDPPFSDDIRRNEPIRPRIRLSDVGHVVIDWKRPLPRGLCAGIWHRNSSAHSRRQHYVSSIGSGVSYLTYRQS